MILDKGLLNGIVKLIFILAELPSHLQLFFEFISFVPCLLNKAFPFGEGLLENLQCCQVLLIISFLIR